MYPHIFVHNVATGSSTIRCDCDKMCSSKRLETECYAGVVNKSHSQHQATNVSSRAKLLYKNDSTAIATWSRQVSKHHSIPLDDNFIASQAPPTPPHTPTKERLTTSSSINDQHQRNPKVSKNKSRLDLLVDAANFIEGQTAIESMYCTTNAPNGLENLLMLADEAVKRIVLVMPMEV